MPPLPYRRRRILLSGYLPGDISAYCIFRANRVSTSRSAALAIRRKLFEPSLPFGLRTGVDRIMRRLRRLFRTRWWHVFTGHVAALAHGRRHRSIPAATARHVRFFGSVADTAPRATPSVRRWSRGGLLQLGVTSNRAACLLLRRRPASRNAARSACWQLNNALIAGDEVMAWISSVSRTSKAKSWRNQRRREAGARRAKLIATMATTQPGPTDGRVCTRESG